MKKCNIVFNILTVIAYFYGVLLCATMVLIPLGVYAVISANRYSQYAEFSEWQLSTNKQNIKRWIIFGCVLYFPIGLIGLLCFKQLDKQVEPEIVDTAKNDTQSGQSAPEENKEPIEVEIHTPQTDNEKAEKLEKLERFKQNGLITEEEFEQAKAELYGDKNNL